MSDDVEKYQINTGFHYLKIIGDLMMAFTAADEWDTVTRINLLRKLSLHARVGAKQTFIKGLFQAFSEINELLDAAQKTGKRTELDAAKGTVQPLINELYVYILEEFNRRDLLLPKKTTMTTGIFRDSDIDTVEGGNE